MWAKLGTDYLNLGQIIRVRFSRAFKNNREEVAAEVEALIKGEIQIFTRYRGGDAEQLLAALDHACEAASGGSVAIPSVGPNTVTDICFGPGRSTGNSR
jgi:hypothetical protein